MINECIRTKGGPWHASPKVDLSHSIYVCLTLFQTNWHYFEESIIWLSFCVIELSQLGDDKSAHTQGLETSTKGK